MKTASFLAAACSAVVLSMGIASADTVQRHLVYNFKFGMRSSAEVHSSGFSGSGGGGGSGVSDYSREDGDEGTITIDVQREQPDHGLVLSVSEQARGTHSAPAATCVVYGTGTLICDPNAKVNAEEYAIVRFLGVNFVDPNLLDAKQHWKMESNGPGYSAVSDYTITKNDDGVMQISEQRELTYGGAGGGKADVASTIGYDFNKTIPTSVHENDTTRTDQGGQYKTINTQIDLTLSSDSMANKS